MDSNTAERIVTSILDIFDRLPNKCKPRQRADGRQEWVPMSAIVLRQKSDVESSEAIKIISIATGAKSLPVSSLPRCQGMVLHDCHAEVLAIRGFNQWLLREIEHILRHAEYVSPWLELDPATKETPFRLRSTVEILMYASEAPCGDASMELLMAANAAAGKDIEPWHSTDSNPVTLPPGRGNFGDLGKLRRKPARADAEISMSKSCTDKLMLKQFSGLLSFPARQFVQLNQASFLQHLIVHQDKHHTVGYERAFAVHGRLNDVPDNVLLQAVFFDVVKLPPSCPRFTFERPSSGTQSKVSNFSAVWLAGVGNEPPITEVLVNGVKQGFKQLDHRYGKASTLSRRKLLDLGMVIGDLMLKSDIAAPSVLLSSNAEFSRVKSSAKSEARRCQKQIVLDCLGGWPHIEDKDKDDFLVKS